MDAIRIENLTKRYKDVLAVDNLNFHVKEGELFAFLGVNGAGKSTTISIMCSALAKDEGKVEIMGIDIDEKADAVKRLMGVVFQNSVLDKSLSVYDNLESRAALYKITGKDFKTRLEELAKLLDFQSLLSRPVGKLSGGQRRKIDIARAIIHSPEILILDEPTTGLDPQTRSLIWQVIHELKEKNNMTVFLTTHYMEEAADADYVVILDKGKIAAEGTPLELKNTYTADFLTAYGIEEEKAKETGVPYEKLRDAYRFQVSGTQNVLTLINKYPNTFSNIEITKGKMDDVFLKVTGKTLTGGDKQ